jgi:transmembrane sensor
VEFTNWLESDPANADAYDRVAALDEELEDVSIPSNRAELDVDRYFQPEPRRGAGSWGIFGSAVAVAAAVALFFTQPWAQHSTPGTEIATGPGERRTIQMADGSSVALNGGSRIRLAGSRAGQSELISGEALFRIRHSADQPFVIKVGDDQVQDLGTTFNLVREADQVRVEVAEGAVRYRRGTSALQLRAGQTLDVAPGGDALVGRKTPLAIGAWRAGQLVYEGAPLAEVVKDLDRNLGVKVSVTPELALRQFTGSINVRGQPEKVLADFSSVVAGRARKTQDGWLIQ